MPKNLQQIRITITRNVKLHKRFFHHNDPRYDFSRKSVITGSHHLLRTASPGHIELWFFGWNQSWYRKKFPLYPLPLAAFIPAIIGAITTAQPTMQPSHHITVDLRPDQKVIVVRNEHGHHVAPFLSTEQIATIHKLSVQYAPYYQSYEEYQKRFHIAFKHAYTTLKADNGLQKKRLRLWRRKRNTPTGYVQRARKRRNK